MTETGAADPVFTRLARLRGEWRGRGAGRYPTIDSFEYEERLDFEPGELLLHYEQRTLELPGRTPSHWESGFVRAVDGRVEVSNAQNSGRVEVLTGELVPGAGDVDFQLTLEHRVLQHDERMVASRRRWTRTGDRLHYIVWMATRTTPEPELLPHLEATLVREA